jgi:hypothetical protein
MVSKNDFSADEWSQVLGSVMMAGMAVTLADPSGLIGMVQEGLASGKSIVDAKTETANSLISSVVADYQTSDGRTAAKDGAKHWLSGKQAPEMKAALLAALAEVGLLVDRKAPQEAAGFKQWLAQISQRVANAAKEDGFLGFGGVRVSDAEKASLQEISKALSLTA